MAVGGRKSPFQSIEQGCDFLFDYTCSPCTADGKNKEATRFCTDCGEYLCRSCLSDHNRFAKMNTHHVVDPAKYDSRCTPPKSSDIPLITTGCDKHHGKVLDMFCGEHQEVCCAACLAFDHSSCKDKLYIPDIATGFISSHDYKQHEIAIHKILKQLHTTKQDRKTDLALHQMKKDVIFANFKQLRQDVNKKFDELEERTVQLVEKRFRINAATVSEDVEKIDKTHEVLQSGINKLKAATNDSQKFVLLKAAEKDLNDAINVLQRISTSKPVSVDFKQSEEISDCLTDFGVLGNFYQKVYLEHRNISVFQDEDEKQCCSIIGFCQLEDGCLVLADVANQSIKKLAASYTIVNICKLSSQPRSVCVVGKEEVAVSMCNEKVIQFVTVKGKMQLSGSFKVKDACAGLASSEEALFVGFLNRKQIQVYTHSGFPLQAIDIDCQNTSCVPWCIAISPNRKLLYVATQENGVILVDIDEKKCRKLDIPALRFATSVALSDDGSLLISSKESNKIILYADGNSDVLLSKTDGIRRPQALCCWGQQELVVASGKSDTIRVYLKI